MFINDTFIQSKTIYDYFNLDSSKGNCIYYMLECEPFSTEALEGDDILNMLALDKIRIDDDMDNFVTALNRKYGFNFKQVVESLPASMQKIVLTSRQELQALYEAQVNMWNKYCGRDDVFCIMYDEKPKHLDKLLDSTLDLVMSMGTTNSPHGYLLFMQVPDVNIFLQKDKKLDMKQ